MLRNNWTRRKRISNPFAHSREGQEIAQLHLMGYKLADNIADLTPRQRKFLLIAVPEAVKGMNQSSGGDKPKGNSRINNNTNSEELKQKLMERRQRG